MSAQLSLSHISKRFRATTAVDDISFTVEAGERLALLGPSGCGKSTILGLIAGLLQPDLGDIHWEGRSILATPTHQRHFGLMFQDYALFPHLDAWQNVVFGLRMAGASTAEIEARGAETLALVGLSGYERRQVATLSGGEQQRVALARALAPRPRLLMLDEPLGALDRALRERLVQELGSILQAAGQTTIYVTHDQEEAFALADRVAVMQAGAIQQIDTPQRLYAQPANPFVAGFIGLGNLLPGKAYTLDGRGMVETGVGVFPLPAPHQGPVTVLLRPDALRLDEPGECRIEGRVLSASFHGSVYRIVIEAGEQQLSFELPHHANAPRLGETVCLEIDVTRGMQLL
jgi:ABC-type Fe3+/spermidine/putrescine transport system ATPase subunit